MAAIGFYLKEDPSVMIIIDHVTNVDVINDSAEHLEHASLRANVTNDVVTMAYRLVHRDMNFDNQELWRAAHAFQGSLLASKTKPDWTMIGVAPHAVAMISASTLEQVMAELQDRMIDYTQVLFDRIDRITEAVEWVRKHRGA